MAKDKAEAVEKEVAVSPAKADMLRIIEAYKKSNPKKYELKRAELDKKLAAL